MFMPQGVQRLWMETTLPCTMRTSVSPAQKLLDTLDSRYCLWHEVTVSEGSL